MQTIILYFSKHGIAIVHNGMIYNDKEIFGKKQRDGEVDSEINTSSAVNENTWR